MKTIEQVRRLRLGMLKEEFVSWVALNEKLGAPSRDSTLSQCMNQSQGSKSKSPKTMGSDLARRLEIACKKPEGWMDTDPDLEGGKWPFDLIPVQRIAALSPSQNGVVQAAMLEALDRLDLLTKRSGTHG